MGTTEGLSRRARGHHLYTGQLTFNLRPFSYKSAGKQQNSICWFLGRYFQSKFRLFAPDFVLYDCLILFWLAGSFN